MKSKDYDGEITPILDNVLIKKKLIDNTYRGIIIPDNYKEFQNIVEVIAVGPGKIDKHGELKKTTVKEGDKVVINKTIGHPIEVRDKEEYFIIKESDIHAIIR